MDKSHLSGAFGSCSGSHSDSSDPSLQSTCPSQNKSRLRHFLSAHANWPSGQMGDSVEKSGLGVDASKE